MPVSKFSLKLLNGNFSLKKTQCCRSSDVCVSTDLVSRFACNTRVINDASSSPRDFYVKLLQYKPRIKLSRKQTETNIPSSINQMVIQQGGKSRRLAVW